MGEYSNIGSRDDARIIRNSETHNVHDAENVPRRMMFSSKPHRNPTHLVGIGKKEGPHGSPEHHQHLNVEGHEEKSPLVSDIHLTNSWIDDMVTFMMSMSPVPDSGKLGDEILFLLFDVIHAAQRSATRLEEALYKKRGVNMSVDNE